MGSEELKKQRFDRDTAASLVKQLRTTFASGKTKSHEWRVAQVKGISKMIDDKNPNLSKLSQGPCEAGN